MPPGGTQRANKTPPKHTRIGTSEGMSHDQYGSVIFVKPGIKVTNALATTLNNIELITNNLGNMRIS